MRNRSRGASLPPVQRSAVPVFLSIADRRDSSRAVRRRRRRRAALLAVAVLVAIGGALVGARSALAAPTPVVSTPADYTPYFQGDVVLADYFCADRTSCGGTRPSGEPIDTATPGRKLFDVSASRDGIGNTRHLAYWSRSDARGSLSGRHASADRRSRADLATSGRLLGRRRSHAS
jgi:hypothetical protein